MNDNVEFVDRHNTASLKWDLLETIYGNKDLLSMWVADMDFRCPDCVNEALKKYIDIGVYGYSALGKRFNSAFIDWEEKVHGYKVKPEWVKFSPGVVQAMFWCVLSMTDPEDSVLVLPPVYYPFFAAATEGGRKLVESNLVFNGKRYEMDFDDIEKKISENSVKMLIFCSPHNPVGRVWERAELEQLLDICIRHNVVIISDEIHHDFTYGKLEHTPFGSLTDKNLVMLTSPSKTFNLAGLHNAVAVIPDDDLRAKWDAFTKKLHVNSGNSLGYIAGEAAYLGGREWNRAVCRQIYENYELFRGRLLDALPEVKIPELEGTYLMWTDFGAYLKEEEIKPFFEEKCGIALDYGKWFHGNADTFVRFNLATSREIVEKAAGAICRELPSLPGRE